MIVNVGFGANALRGCVRDVRVASPVVSYRVVSRRVVSCRVVSCRVRKGGVVSLFDRAERARSVVGENRVELIRIDLVWSR
jgi:hypothetical protein